MRSDATAANSDSFASIPRHSWFDYRELLRNFVVRDLKVRYKHSALGFLWSLLSPLLLMVVLSVVFSRFVKFDVGGHTYPAFLICGLFPWIFFSTTATMSCSVIFENANLVKKIYFPRELLPTATLLGGLIHFLLSLCAMIPVLLYFGEGLKPTYVLVPALVIIQTVFVWGGAMLFAGSTVVFRDIRHILEVLLAAWFYLTPVIYPMRLAQENLSPTLFKLYSLGNPMTLMVSIYQDLVLYGSWGSGQAWILSALWAVAAAVVGLTVFRVTKRRFVELI